MWYLYSLAKLDSDLLLTNLSKRLFEASNDDEDFRESYEQWMYAGAWVSHANAVWCGAVVGVLKHADVCHGDGASMSSTKMCAIWDHVDFQLADAGVRRPL